MGSCPINPVPREETPFQQTCVRPTKKRRPAINQCKTEKCSKTSVERMQSIEDVALAFDGVVRTSHGLVERMKAVGSGVKILLGKCVFEGSFEFSGNNVEIIGQGSDTVLKFKCTKDGSCVTVTGNGCSISGIKIISDIKECVGVKIKGNSNTLRDIEMTEVNTSVYVEGNENQLQDLVLSNAIVGIKIIGTHNTLNGIKLDNVQNGIRIGSASSRQNIISNVTGVNVKFGIYVWHGSSNTLSNITLVKESQESGYTGVDLNSGSNHTISNFNCTGYSKDQRDWGLRINAKNCSVNDSKCGPIYAGDRASATLTNVDCGELIQIIGPT